jgi:hypothetical protein
MDPRFIVGLDLGQTTDYSALVVLEEPAAAEPGAGEPVLALRHLQRFPTGTPYTAVVPAVLGLINRLPRSGATHLVVDQTGVGRPVVDMFRQGMDGRLAPVTITAGRSVTVAADGSWRVPKRELVAALQSVLRERRLRVARSLPDVDALLRELNDFRVTVTAAADETFAAGGAGRHDDLVTASALACWWAGARPGRANGARIPRSRA